jgi:hypothetical protein
LVHESVIVLTFSEAMGQDILGYFEAEEEARWLHFAASLRDETGSVGEPEMVSALTSSEVRRRQSQRVVM